MLIRLGTIGLMIVMTVWAITMISRIVQIEDPAEMRRQTPRMCLVVALWEVSMGITLIVASGWSAVASAVTLITVGGFVALLGKFLRLVPLPDSEESAPAEDESITESASTQTRPGSTAENTARARTMQRLTPESKCPTCGAEPGDLCTMSTGEWRVPHPARPTQ